MAIATPTIGVFGIIFDKTGNILVKQRERWESAPGEWDLPGGGVEVDVNASAIDERIVGQEILRELKEETGLGLSPLQRMPALYPAVIKGGKDWAFVTIIGVVDQKPTKGNWRYVSPIELEELAKGPIDNRLLSGYGKRMHRMILRAFVSRDCPNESYRIQAQEMLKKIQAEQ